MRPAHFHAAHAAAYLLTTLVLLAEGALAHAACTLLLALICAAQCRRRTPPE
jgi:hypothetical protein